MLSSRLEPSVNYTDLVLGSSNAIKHQERKVSEALENEHEFSREQVVLRAIVCNFIFHPLKTT